MQNNKIKRAFFAALPRTLPVFAGYCFLGMTYGILLSSNGLPTWFPIIMTLSIFSGSAEILAVGMLASTFNPLNALVIALMTGARYLFYGISMLDKYKGVGWKKFFLIYETVDETFSINFQAVLAPDVDRGWFYLFVTWLDHAYWIFGSLMGAFFGSILGGITEKARGLDFVVTAMFVVIFLNQWMTEKRHWSELIGVLAAVASLLVFGRDNFLIPTMVLILAALMVFRKPLTKVADENEEYKVARAIRLDELKLKKAEQKAKKKEATK